MMGFDKDDDSTYLLMPVGTFLARGGKLIFYAH